MAKLSTVRAEDLTVAAAKGRRRIRTVSVEPSKPTEPLKRTRQTRSQSAEPNELSRPVSRGQSAQSKRVSETSTGKRERKPRGTAAATAPELDTVEEDVSVDEEAQQNQIEAQLQTDLQGEREDVLSRGPQDANEDDASLFEQQDDADDVPPLEPHDADEDRPGASRLSAISTFSGTTAKTSFTQEELAEMQPQVMIPVLPSLAASCDALAELLLNQDDMTPLETCKEVRRQDSPLRMLHNDQLRVIGLYKRHFGSEEYIRPRLVLRATLDASPDTLTQGAWRPDDLIYKINLIHMLDTLLIDCDPSNWSSENTYALARLARTFPEVIAGEEFSLPAMEFWLNLAAQLAIVELETHNTARPSSFVARKVIHEIFYDEDNAFVHFDALHVGSAPVSDAKASLDMVNALVAELVRPFDRYEAAVAITKLRSTFRWSALKDHVLRYYANRQAELNDRIAAAGGAEQIKRALTHERAKELAQTRTGLRKSLGGGSKAAATALSRIAKRTSSAPQPDERITSNLDEASQLNETEVNADMPAVQNSDNKHKNEPPMSRPPPSLLDPQPNATRVSVDFDDEETQARSKTTPRKSKTASVVAPASVKGKRSRAVMEDEEGIPDPTQDAGFETDARDIAGADQRRAEIAGAARAPNPIRSPTRDFEAGPSHSTSLSARPSPSKRQRLNPGSSLPAPLPEVHYDEDERPASSRYARAKVTAKLNRIVTSSQGPRMRLPWSEDEEDALIDLIEQHGGETVSYAFLKVADNQQGERLRRRTAEDMRFKARNMKTTLLLAGGGLPPNWEHVLLGKKEIDKLKARNIDYDQDQIRRRAASIESR